jgi:hypothetical protein
MNTGVQAPPGMINVYCSFAYGDNYTSNASACTISPEQYEGLEEGPPAQDCNQTLTAEITGFTAGSPMAGLAATFMKWAATYNVDPRFIVALADAESGLGRNQGNACNDFGYFYNGYQICSPFQSYDSEIQSVTKNIRTRHLGKGQKTAQQVFNSGGPLSYCNGDCSTGLNTITTDMGKMGANPNNLLSPCNPDGTWKKQ